MRKKRMLIISVSAGAGHVSAAQALLEEARRSYPHIVCEHIDMIDYVSPAVRHAIVDIYDKLVRTIPRLWGYVYEKTNDEKRVRYLTKFIKRVTRWNAKRFYEYVDTFSPDEIICTHSFPAQVIRQSKNQAIAKLPISLVLTDYGFHSYWIMPRIRHYFVATEKMKWEMEQQVMGATISVTGIPVRPIFFDRIDTTVLQKNHNIQKTDKVILVLAGGQGMLDSTEVVELLRSHTLWHSPVHIIAVAGTNVKLYNSLKKQESFNTATLQLHAIGWTDQMAAYMSLADAVISKPGGITTSECLALGKPLITIQPIPGQEERNAEHILEVGAGYVSRTDIDILYYVRKIFSEKKNPSQKQQNPAKQILEKIL